MPDGRGKDRKDSGRNKNRNTRGLENCHINTARLHLSVFKNRDGALVMTAAGVMMQAFMQVWRHRQGVQQQDKAGQQ